MLIEHIYAVIKGVLWIILSGFLLSFFMAMLVMVGSEQESKYSKSSLAAPSVLHC